MKTKTIEIPDHPAVRCEWSIDSQELPEDVRRALFEYGAGCGYGFGQEATFLFPTRWDGDGIDYDDGSDLSRHLLIVNEWIDEQEFKPDDGVVRFYIWW